MGIFSPAICAIQKIMSGYNIANAYMLDNAASYWSKTLTTSATHSGSIWIGRTKLGEVEPILDGSIYFNASDQLVVNGLTSTAKYRDPTAFMHIFWNSTGAWVNGVAVTGTGTYATASIVNPRWGFDGTNYAGMYFSEHAFWDGSSVALNGGEPDVDTGSWITKKTVTPIYTRTDWLVNGTITQVTSTPTNTYATLNPLDPASGPLSNGNLTLSSGSATVTLQPQSGNWYYEKNNTGVSVVGVFNPTLTSGTYNFGATAWNGVGPSGAEKAVSTDNLPAITATEKNVDQHFKTVAYTGDGTSSHALGTGFSVDFAWFKLRSGAGGHVWFDSNRGITKNIVSNSAAAEVTTSGELVSFDATGVTIGENGGSLSINASGSTYVAWCASLPNTKTSGWAGSPTITPTKEIYNTDLGMSIVTYTGNGVAGATIPHSLGVQPRMIIVKRLDSAINWPVYHKDLGPTKILQLDLSNASNTSITWWNNTAPTNQLITLGTGAGMNASGGTYVAYIFAESDFVKIGSYTGNASTDGPFVNNGSSASWHISKRSDGASNWFIMDTERSPANVIGDYLLADSSQAEVTGSSSLDFTANGHKIRSSGTGLNASGGTYLYMTIGQPNGSSETTAR